MTASTISFFVWVGLMVLMLLFLFWEGRKKRAAIRQIEDIASKALPEIGQVAERAHSLRFGVPLNGARPEHSWYPPKTR
jgi:predicted PurR-regulated permease PerM